jgi:hypothetical protein
MARQGPKPLRCTLELCALAGQMLREAGFVLHTASRKSTATYYRWPGRSDQLRVADHAKDKKPNGLERVVARVTFSGAHAANPGYMRISDDKVEQMVAQAIGRYFMRSTAPLAQLERALGSEPRGRRFESCGAHHYGSRSR